MVSPFPSPEGQEHKHQRKKNIATTPQNASRCQVWSVNVWMYGRLLTLLWLRALSLGFETLWKLSCPTSRFTPASCSTVSGRKESGFLKFQCRTYLHWRLSSFPISMLMFPTILESLGGIFYPGRYWYEESVPCAERTSLWDLQDMSIFTQAAANQMSYFSALHREGSSQETLIHHHFPVPVKLTAVKTCSPA